MTAQAHRSDGEARVHLTPAESDVLAFLPTHLTVEAIAARLGRSRSTVKTHLAHIYGKLGVTGRMAAVDRAWELGLLAEPGGHQVQIASLVAEPRLSGRSLASGTHETTTATKER
jgi:DNA-binding CsgD family transcriptional regulator